MALDYLKMFPTFLLTISLLAITACNRAILYLKNPLESDFNTSSLLLTPLQHHFGNISTTATSSPQDFAFTNTSLGIVLGCSTPVISNSTDFSITLDNCGNSDIAPGGFCTVSVEANPATSGLKSTTLSRTCLVEGVNTTVSNQITVTGTAPSLYWFQLAHNFGTINVGSNSSNQVFTLTNIGNGSATGCSVPTISNSTDFSIVSDGCNTGNLSANGSSCNVSIRANPSSVGAKSTTLSRFCTVGGVVSTTANQITVTGVSPTLAWSPLTHSFGSINVGSNAGNQTFTLTNTGTGNATGCSAPTISNSTDFTLVTDNCSTNNVTSGGGSCTVSVRANPASTGAKSATLSRSCTVGGVASTTANQITTTGTSVALAWSPLTHSFSSINVGSNSSGQTFTLTNSGTADATGCSAPTISNATDFTIVTDNCSTNNVTSSGGTCTVSVRANPASTGAKSATLSRSCTVGGVASTTANQITVTGTSPSLAWSPLTHAFGSINVGSNSSNQTFTLTNSGTADATACSAPTISNSTDFTLVTDNCSTNNVTASGGSCTVSVRANPASTGAKSATLSRSCTVGGVASTTANQITVTGTSAVLAWSPLTHDFGNILSGSNSGNQTFTLTNSGTGEATGCSAPTISNSTDFTLVTDNCSTNNVTSGGGSCTVSVRANPASTGAKSATLSRSCTVGGVASTTANQITTTGTEAILAWSPLTHAFGSINVGSNSSGQTFTLSNSGTADATGCSAPTISNSTDFTLVTDNCSTNNVTAAGGSCTVSVRANPASTGAKSATLSRSCTVGGVASTTANQITVTGTTATLAWSPLSHGFGNISVGANSSSEVFTLTNSGTGDATGCSAPTLTNSTDFTIVTDNCSTNNVTSGGGSCTVSVRANPASTGAKSATLSRSCTVGGVASTTANQITVTGTSAVLAWSPLTHAFGNVNVGTNSASETFTLTNSGTGDATGCSAPTISNATDFTIVTDNCSTNNVTSSGGSCTVSVRANPASTGAKSATLSRSCTVGGVASTTANQITVTGISAVLAWSPLTHAFGSINVGSNSSNQTFTLTNSGTGDATACSAPTISNSTDFTIVTDNCSTNNVTASGGSCTVSVRANPASTGAKSATLSRSCTVGGVASTTANQITVTGISAVLAWSPLTHAFGNISVGANSSSEVFTLTNSGTGDATGCSVPTLTNSTDFTIVTDNCSTNNVTSGGGSCTVSVRANPASTGAKSATLSRSCTVGGVASTTANQITTTGTEAILAWSPLTHAFGSINVGSNTSGQTFTLTNSGTGDATACSAPTISNSTDFTLVTDNCSTNNVTASGGSCTVSVRANPASTGAKSATLSRSCTVGGVASTTANQITVTGISAVLAWSPLTHAFGSINVGSNSSNQTFTLTNSGTADATGCSAPTISNATDFTLVTDNCSTNNVTSSGGSCTVSVRANPASTGAKSATLSRSCTVGGTVSTTANQITVTGTSATLAWSPLSHGFGNISVGANSSSETFTLTNSGTGDATGCSAPTLFNSTDFTIVTDNCSTNNVTASGGSCTVSVRANPASAGIKSTTLSRSCTVGGVASTNSNQITTTGVTAPALAWSPLSHGFGNVNIGSNSSAQVFTLTNSGNEDATGCSAPTISNSTDFTITVDNCSTNNVTMSGGSCTVSVRANPASAGVKSTTMSRTCTIGGVASTTANQITTTGTEAILAWSPLTHAFGSINVSSNSSNQTFTLSNSGTADATGCSAPTISNATDFTLVTDNCSTNNVTSGGGSCTVSVRANPASTGAKSATLSRSCTMGGVASTTANQITTTGTEAILAWSPLTHAFGSINVSSNSSNQTFTLTNSGTADATGCSAPTISNATDFTLVTDNCSTNNVTSGGGSCTVSVRANPASTGAKSATLSRSCTMGGVASTTANQITVTGTSATLAWSPLTHAFGSINVGSNSSNQTFTLTNSGTGDATGCSAPTISNATDFTLVTDNCSTNNVTASGGTCTVSVRANPASTGAKSATLSRSCTVGGVASTTANQITVTGISAVLAWSPLTHAFGSINVGSNTSGQTFTLTNSGTADATGCSAPTISNATDFTIVTDNCSTNNVTSSGGTCTVSVRANPASTGAKSATLSRSCTVGGVASTTANQITVTGTSAALAWSPLTHDFGNILAGSNSSNQTFTLTNSGTGEATGCSAPILSNVTDFTIVTDNCSTNNLTASGGTCSVSLRANPASLGSKVATLSRNCTVGGLASTTMNQITVTGVTPTPTQLAFSVQPSNTVAGQSITSAVKIEILDASNNLVTTATNTVTIAIANNPGSGTLSGTLSVAAVNGVATFSNLSINKTGTGYTLSAASSGLTSATSSGFNITAASPTVLAFSSGSPTSFNNNVCSAAFTVQTKDSFGNLSAVSSPLVVDLTHNGGGLALFYTNSSCTSGVITSVTVASSQTQAVFYMKHDTVESFTLTAFTSGFTDATRALNISSSSNYWTADFLASAPVRSNYAYDPGFWGDVNAVWTGTELIAYLSKYNPSTNSWSKISYTNSHSSSRNTAVWTGSLMVVLGVTQGSRYNPATDTWSYTSPSPIPSRYAYTVVWTGTEAILWGGATTSYFNTGARYNPSTDTWTEMTTTGAPSARSSHSAVWTGTEMIIWGGWDGSSPQKSGGRYNPSTNSWSDTNLTGAPLERYYHTAVWSGSEMIVWGGLNNATVLNTGAKYNPSSNAWTATATSGAPVARMFPSAVWTGTQMVIWGGAADTSGTPLNSGGRYTPGSNSWSSISTTNSPTAYNAQVVWNGTEMYALCEHDTAKYNPSTNTWSILPNNIYRFHQAVWTGTEIILWGGTAGSGTKFNPSTNSWTAISSTGSPSVRTSYTAVWSGTEMIVWGGEDSGASQLNTGARYNVSANTWTATATSGAPSARKDHTAIWTGTEMIIWGGWKSNNPNIGHQNTGARYTPGTNSWSATSTTSAPDGRRYHTAVWSGNEMIVWGGETALINRTDSGGRYSPSLNSWSSTNIAGVPSGRTKHTAVWTGSKMVVWGGSNGSDLATGGLYDPSSNSWVATNTTGAPSARSNHFAIWTGSLVIIWGADLSQFLGGRLDPVSNTWTNTTIPPNSIYDTSKIVGTATWTGSQVIFIDGNMIARYHP